MQDRNNIGWKSSKKRMPFLTSVSAECRGTTSSEQAIIRKQHRPPKLFLLQLFLRAILIGVIQIQTPPDMSNNTIFNFLLNYSKFLSEKLFLYELVISC